jgi:hypothetical protein
MRDERLEVSVTFDPARGYVATAPELRAPVVALRLGGLRRKIEIAMLPSVSRRRDVAGRGIAVQAREGGCSPVGGLSVRKRRLPDAHAAKPRGAPDFHR